MQTKSKKKYICFIVLGALLFMIILVLLTNAFPQADSVKWVIFLLIFVSLSQVYPIYKQQESITTSFHRRIADGVTINLADFEDYLAKMSISPYMDYKLQQKYKKEFDNRKESKGSIWKAIFIGLLIVVLVSIADRKVDDAVTKISLNIKDVDESVFINPSEEYIVHGISGIEGITDIRTDVDRNKMINKKNGCSSVVYFFYDKLNEKEVGETSSGGCIEVFFDVESARDRMSQLRMSKSVAGSSYRIGSVVVRTSNLLSTYEQNKLQNRILKAFIDNPPNSEQISSYSQEEIAQVF